MKKIYFILLLSLMIISCKKNATDFATPSPIIGATMYGGIVFYIDSTGKHGMVAARSDQSGIGSGPDGKGFLWSSPTAEVGFHNIIGYKIGTGKENTNAIVSAFGADGHYAALVCDQLILNGYSDWYLPSEFELMEMFSQNHYLKLQSLYYWSSTESNQNWSICYKTTNVIGSQPNNKLSYYAVRAIRTF